MSLTDEFFQPKDVQKVLGISRTTLYRWTQDGLLTPKKVRRKVFYSVEQARQLMTPEGTVGGNETPSSEKSK